MVQPASCKPHMTVPGAGHPACWPGHAQPTGLAASSGMQPSCIYSLLIVASLLAAASGSPGWAVHAAGCQILAGGQWPATHHGRQSRLVPSTPLCLPHRRRDQQRKHQAHEEGSQWLWPLPGWALLPSSPDSLKQYKLVLLKPTTEALRLHSTAMPAPPACISALVQAHQRSLQLTSGHCRAWMAHTSGSLLKT